MNCVRLVELITDYLEDAMPDPQRLEVEEHLSGCDDCTTYLEQCRATIRLTGMLTEEQLPAEAREALRGVFRNWRTSV